MSNISYIKGKSKCLKIFVVFILFCSTACQKKVEEKSGETAIRFDETNSWNVTEAENQYRLEWNGLELKHSFAIKKSALPLNKIVVANPSAIAYLEALGTLDKVVGYRGAQYVYSEKVNKKLYAEPKLNLGNYENTELESIIKIKPQLVIASATQKNLNTYKQLEKYNIPVLYFNEYDEQNALARLEHIKVFGLLLGKSSLANELYEKRKKAYLDIIKKVKQEKVKQTVFFNCIYGDIWYMPGKSSMMVNIIKSLQVNYPWDEDKRLNLPLSFEAVLSKAKNTEVWLNVSDFKSKKELLANDERYSWFDAYKNNRMYSTAKRKSENGANDFYEQGILRPDLVIKDIAAILYPNIFPEHELYFYTHLK